MYTILGITGNVGGATARSLLAAGKKIRAVVRDRSKAAAWARQGADVVVADMLDATALAHAFAGTQGVFVMIPANFAPAPGFPETRALVAALRTALDRSRPPKAVYLSSVGAHRESGLGLISQIHILERELGSLPIPNAFVRAAWFMENFQWDVGPAMNRGEIDVYLDPLDRAIPMVSTQDIGRLAAGALQQAWSGNRFLELEGPRRYSPLDATEILTGLLGREVRPRQIPRAQWAAEFERGGTPADRTASRIEMLDGFNSGWIDFEILGTEHRRGEQTLAEVLQGRLKAQPSAASA
jgi:uncharacterized protein YbjT (DUF2867 family)